MMGMQTYDLCDAFSGSLDGDLSARACPSHAAKLETCVLLVGTLLPFPGLDNHELRCLEWQILLPTPKLEAILILLLTRTCSAFAKASLDTLLTLHRGISLVSSTLGYRQASCCPRGIAF